MSALSNRPPTLEELDNIDVSYTEETKSSSFLTRNGRLVRTLGTLGLVGVAAIAGFVAGQATKPATTSNGSTNNGSSGGTDAIGSVALARATMKDAVDAGNPVLANISATDLVTVVDMYQTNPGAWEDQYLTHGIMESLVVYRKVEDGASSRRLGARRGLIGSYDTDLVDAAWERHEKRSFPSPFVYSNDQFQLTREGNTCWLTGSATSDLADWMDNLDVGSDDILALKPTLQRVEECGCERTTLWWCAEYLECPSYRVLGRGYDGFVKVYNDMRLEVADAVLSQCDGALLNIVGYSRGAGILSPFAYALVADGLVSPDNLQLVTFGSPRVFEDAISDAAQDVFTHWRMVHNSDIVTSIPYDWWGYKHFGTMRCMDCDYEEGRDRPYGATSIDDHTSYCEVFGDKTC